ncbi:hypothetical protein BWI97_25480 [Siphonobacter sp. BAB-5405]|nr:hypothetical protein BWI97_25480 [Siphonobacter sp. BAB-5405]
MNDLSGSKQLQLFKLLDKAFYFYTLGLLIHTSYVPADLLYCTLRQRFKSLLLDQFQHRMSMLEDLGIVFIRKVGQQDCVLLKADYHYYLHKLYLDSSDTRLSQLMESIHKSLQ